MVAARSWWVYKRLSFSTSIHTTPVYRSSLNLNSKFTMTKSILVLVAMLFAPSAWAGCSPCQNSDALKTEWENAHNAFRNADDKVWWNPELAGPGTTPWYISVSCPLPTSTHHGNCYVERNKYQGNSATLYSAAGFQIITSAKDFVAQWTSGKTKIVLFFSKWSLHQN